MPYIIHIPAYYQSRNYTFPRSYTTSTASISLSRGSDLAAAIYRDTTEWGWHTEQAPPHDPATWSAYVAKAKRKAWFRDIFAIWQREHGIRIRERDKRERGEVSAGKGGMVKEGLKKVARWWKEEVRDCRARSRVDAKELGLRRCRSEPALRGLVWDGRGM